MTEYQYYTEYKTNFRILIYIFLFILAGYVVSTIGIPFVGHDSGFYLKYSLDMSQWASYYSDLNIAYTPLAMYILALFFKINPHIPVTVLFTFICLLYFIAAGLFYFMVRNLKTDKTTSLLYSVILAVALFVEDGANVQLEPFVLIFQLIAVLLIQKWLKVKSPYLLFLAGFSCFLAYFSKQYGLSVLLGITWVIYHEKKSWKRFFLNLLTFGIGLLIFKIILLAWLSFNNIERVDTFLRLSGLKVFISKENITGTDYSMVQFLKGIVRLFTEMPVTLLVFMLFYPKNRFSYFSGNLIFAVLLSAGAMAQLFFAAYRHYFQLIVPFLLLIVVLIIQDSKEQFRAKSLKYFYLSCILFVFTSIGLLISRFEYRIKRYERQVANSKEILRILPEGEKVYLQGISPAYYYLCRFNSPDFKKLGYRFPEELTPGYISENIPKGSYLIASPDYYSKPEIKNNFELYTNFRLAENKDVYILKKNN